MRIFLAAHAPRRAGAGIEQPGFLHNGAAAFDEIDLAPRLGFHRLHDEAHRIDVLRFGARAKAVTRSSHRDIDIGAHRAFVHIAIATADIAQQLAQRRDISPCFGRTADVGLGDNLHQRTARTVQIDIAHRRMQIVHRLAGVLLKVDALDADNAFVTRFGFDSEHAFPDDRVEELADLVTLRQIGVEIILAIKARPLVDFGAQREARPHCLPHALAIEHRQHPRHRRIDQRHLAVRLRPERRRRTGKQLGVGRHLGVNLEAHDDLELARGALDAIAAAAAVVCVSHARLLRRANVVGKSLMSVWRVAAPDFAPAVRPDAM